MKLYDFLLEYKRDITRQTVGDQLLQAFVKSHVPSMPDDLYNLHNFVSMKFNKFLRPRGIRLNLFGDQVVATPDTIDEIYDRYRDRITDEILKFLESVDPTRNRSYMRFLVKSFINDPQFKFEDYNRHDILSLYDINKARGTIRPEHRDIMRYKNYREFERDILANYSLDGLQSVADSSGKSGVDRGQYQEVFADDQVRVIRPDDQRAACYYGRGTVWCTAATRGHNYYDQYASRGPLYIFLPQKPRYPGEKYQAHIATSQFADKNDDMITLDQLLDRFPTFTKTWLELEPKLKTSPRFMSDQRIDDFIDVMNQAVSKKLQSVIALEGEDDPDYLDWLKEKIDEAWSSSANYDPDVDVELAKPFAADDDDDDDTVPEYRKIADKISRDPQYSYRRYADLHYNNYASRAINTVKDYMRSMTVDRFRKLADEATGGQRSEFLRMSEILGYGLAETAGSANDLVQKIINFLDMDVELTKNDRGDQQELLGILGDGTRVYNTRSHRFMSDNDND